MAGEVRWRDRLFACVLCLGCPSAEGEVLGAPPHVGFDYPGNVEGQFYGIVRDDRGRVLLGHDSGVLVYDGERWTASAAGAERVVRSLAIDADRLFVGGYNSFGEMQTLADGRLRYRDLAPRFAEVLDGREFADIWDVLVTPEGVYFRALRDLFLWKPVDDSVQHWYHEGRFGAIAHRDGRTWLQFRGEGFRCWQDGEWRLQDSTRGLTELIFDLLPLPGGDWLSLGSDGRWWRINEHDVVQPAMPEGLPPSLHFQHSARLDDGSLALASTDGTVIILQPSLDSIARLRLEYGFLGGIESVTGGMLVSGSRGFHHVSWPSALTVVDESQGAVGSILRIGRWHGIDHLMTTAGLLRSERDEGVARFAQFGQMKGRSAHDLWPLDTATAVVAATHRLYLLRDGIAQPLTDELIYPRLFEPSRFVKDRVFVGTEDGLRVLRTQASTAGEPGVQLRTRIAPPAAHRISSIVELSPQDVWVGTERHGVWRYVLDADGNIDALAEVRSDSGIRPGDDQRAVLFRLPDDRLAASTRAGLFVRGDDGFEPLRLGDLDSLREPDELLHPVFGEDGTTWAYSERRLLFSRDGRRWSELPARRLRRGAYVSHSLGAAGEARFASDGAVVIHQPGRPTASDQPPQVQLTSVTRIQPDGRRTRLPLDRSPALQLTAGHEAIDFRYALADLSSPRERSYRVRLLGYESAFTPWESTDGYSYWDLPPGAYRLEVEARDSEGRISRIAPFALVIEPAWYATWWARLLWLLLAAVLAAIVVRVLIERRTRRLLLQTQQLESTIAERTRSLADANRQLERMAHVDGLTGVSNRRRLDEYLVEVHAVCVERQRPLGVLAIDADHFKDYNDRHGHLAGDAVLRRLAEQLSHCLRRTEDLLGRFGGEEFLVVLPGADLARAVDLAEQMRRSVEESALGVTVSIGVASRVPEAAASPDVLIALADAALYRAKQGGRNRVERDASG